MNSFKILDNFNEYFSDEKCTEGLATVKSLRDLICNSSASTINEYHSILNSAVEEIAKSDYSLAPIMSAADLFMRFITLCKLDNTSDFKSNLIKKADLFIAKITKSIDVISNFCQSYLKGCSSIIVLGQSKTVWEALYQHVKINRRKDLVIYVIGVPVEQYKLKLFNISNYVSVVEIGKASLSHYLEKVDVALFGAEAVVGNGGIINEIGTKDVAILAHAHHVPFYVLTEIFRFIRLFPLSQTDIPVDIRYRTSVRNKNEDLTNVVPDVEYVAPDYIKMIVTDIGYIPPCNVSEELFKLYL